MNLGVISKYLSINFVKRPIIVPLATAIIRVPKLTPLNPPKNTRVIIVAQARQTRSKQVLKTGVLMPYFPLTALKKKS